VLYNKRPLNKRCRILPAEGLGVSPRFKKVPPDCGNRGLTENISAISVIQSPMKRHEEGGVS
jgi:hypothetical protein